MNENKIGFNNFKAFGGKMQTFSKKPITLVYGPNSIGKSSFLHSQLYFEYIKESGKLDLHSTKFAGDEFDLNGFDSFVHEKDTINSINFETIIKNEDDIYDLLNMFNRGLTKNEIQTLISNIKTNDDAMLWLNKIDKDTYQYYSILNILNEIKKFKVVNEEYNSILHSYNVKNADEAYANISCTIDSIESIRKNLQEILISNFRQFEIKERTNYARSYIDKYGLEAFKEKDKAESELGKIIDEEDNVLKNRMLEIYTEKWLEKNREFPGIGDVEISIFKLLYFNVSSLKDEQKENIALNLMHEVDFLNYLCNINTLIINFQITKSSTQELILNISYNIDGEELFQAKQEEGNHKIFINKNNKFLLELNKKYKSFINISNPSETLNLLKKHKSITKEEIEKYERITGANYNLLEEIGNFSASLLWVKDEKDLLLTMSDTLHSMFDFFDSDSWSSTLHLKESIQTLFYPLVLDTVLFVIGNNKMKRNQYFGPLRFYLNRSEHIIKKEINKDEKLNGENIWEYIKQSVELQEKLNKLLSNKNMFNTTYLATIVKKLNLYDLEINSLDFQNKTSPEIVEILRDISKVDNELVFIDTTKNDTPVGLRDMGLGNSQMIPFLLLCNYEASTKFFIEQPELHLHPRIQAELADEFIRSYKERDNEFIIETHSEHLLLRIMKRMKYTAENKQDRDKSLDLTPDEVCVIYVDSDGKNTTLKELKLSKDGTLLDYWPDGFFDEDFDEVFS